jgi:hypothetical protein
MKFQGKLGGVVVVVVVQEQDTTIESWKGKIWRREKKARVMPEEASKGEVKVIWKYIAAGKGRTHLGIILLVFSSVCVHPSTQSQVG